MITRKSTSRRKRKIAMKWKIRKIIHKFIHRLVPKKHKRKFGMWVYGLVEEDMHDDITYWNCR